MRGPRPVDPIRRNVIAGGVAMGLFGKLFGGGDDAKAAQSEKSALPRYAPGMSDAEIDAVFARARAELEMKTGAHIGMWGADAARWDVDLDVGRITFTNTKGWRIVAPVQVIGTLNKADGTFLWGWDHPSVPAPVSVHARRVHDFGEAQGLEALTTRKIEASEEQAWEMTALAMHLAGAQGAYRGPSGSTLVFMTYGELTITKS